MAVTALALAALACSVDTSTGGGGGGSGSSARDLSREYEVTGVNMQGNRYSGEATLTRISGNQYAVNWLIADSAQTGAGTLDGDTFTPTWSDGQVSGTASYTVQPDGTLEGTWTQDGVSGEGTETLTPR